VHYLTSLKLAVGNESYFSALACTACVCILYVGLSKQRLNGWEKVCYVY